MQRIRYPFTRQPKYLNKYHPKRYFTSQEKRHTKATRRFLICLEWTDILQTFPFVLCECLYCFFAVVVVVDSWLVFLFSLRFSHWLIPIEYPNIEGEAVAKKMRDSTRRLISFSIFWLFPSLSHTWDIYTARARKIRIFRFPKITLAEWMKKCDRMQCAIWVMFSLQSSL